MKDFFEYIKKNKYVIICISIVVVLYALGIVDFLLKFFVLIALIALAIFVGKKLQDNEGKIGKIFSRYKKDKDVYYYQEKQDKE